MYKELKVEKFIVKSLQLCSLSKDYSTSWRPYKLKTLHFRLFIHYFITSSTLMPGRNPFTSCKGAAFTSKVLRSNWPVVFVAFQAA